MAAHAIIDTHIHLFDPTRPQGVPWPPKEHPAHQHPALPARLREVSQGLGITGAIAVECSPWFDDNQWVLDVAAKDPVMVGVVGNLDPGKPDFASHIERFHKDPLFLGIRNGNLWQRDLRADLARPEFVAGLKLFAGAGLTLDTANLNPKLMEDILRLTDRVPDLRIVLDHTPRLNDMSLLPEAASRPRVYAKISAVLGVDGIEAKLDKICAAFGPDRVLYGSDWPNSDPNGSYAEGFKVVRKYFDAKGREAAEKYFWRNSAAAYRWKKR